MENIVEEIKNKIDIVDFIGNFITLKKAGKNFKSVCPFHNEKTPSFVISPERQIWHCFGACQEGGDVVKFLMKWENITFFEALRELAEKTGVKLRKVSFEDRVWKKKERLISVNQLAAEFFQYVLNKTKFGKKALEYLEGRKINPKIAKTFQLGYAPQSWDSLSHFLKKKRYEMQEMFEAGLLVKSERGSYYDRFRGRLVFPIKDMRGNVIGFSGRTLDKGSQEAKYINTPETSIYHKRETLYGINLAKESIKKAKEVILVEGEFDVISPYQAGVENIVAIKGSAVTKEQLMLIKRYTNKIIFALDTDEAGIAAIKRGAEEAEGFDFEIGVVDFDYAKDPDEAVQKDADQFKKIIKKPSPVYDFLIDINKKKYLTDDPFSKKRIGEEIIPFIGTIKNPIIHSHYVKKLATFLEVDENSIETLIKQEKYKKKKANILKLKKNPVNELPRGLIIQKYILSLIFQNKDPYELIDRLTKILEIDDFTLASYQKIYRFFLEYKKKNDKFDLNNFADKLPSELQAVFDEVYLFASSDIGLENEKIEKLCYEIKKFSLKKKLSKILELEDYLKPSVKSQLLLLNQSLKEVEKMIFKL